MDGFVTFLADMGPRPSRRYTLDRFPNIDGNYEPGNVRWATWDEQARNRRTTHLVCFRGQQMLVRELALLVGIQYTTLKLRLRKWGDVERAATAPLRHIGRRL